VAGGFGPATVGQATWERDAAEVAFVSRGAGASAGRREGDVADLASVERTVAFGCEWRKGVVAVEAMFRRRGLSVGCGGGKMGRMGRMRRMGVRLLMRYA